MDSPNGKNDGLIPAVYSAMEMAILLNMTEWMVYQRAKTGKIPGSLKIGPTYRFIKSVINEWLGIGDDSDDGGSKAS